jgi:hypothetical protein
LVGHAGAVAGGIVGVADLAAGSVDLLGEPVTAVEDRGGGKPARVDGGQLIAVAVVAERAQIAGGVCSASEVGGGRNMRVPRPKKR